MTDPFSNSHAFTQTLLRKEKWRAIFNVPRENIEIDVTTQAWANEDVYIRLVKQEYEAMREDCGRVKYPADWWQAFKERFFPPWALERWPVKYTEHYVVEMFPNFVPRDNSYLQYKKDVYK